MSSLQSISVSAGFATAIISMSQAARCEMRSQRGKSMRAGWSCFNRSQRTRHRGAHSDINLLMKLLAIPLSAMKHALSGWLCATPGQGRAVLALLTYLTCMLRALHPVLPYPKAARYDFCRYVYLLRAYQRCVENVASDGRARRERMRKRNVLVVHEHSEFLSNAALASV